MSFETPTDEIAIRRSIARKIYWDILVGGYCTERNSKKILDPDLIMDMAKECVKFDENQILAEEAMKDMVYSQLEPRTEVLLSTPTSP